MGEGYHNFHHQFPMDYRNAYLWYQWDPTKWFIALCSFLSLATNLKMFSENEINKGILTMELKRMKKVQDKLVWPRKADELAVWSWERREWLQFRFYLHFCVLTTSFWHGSQARVRRTETFTHLGLYPWRIFLHREPSWRKTTARILCRKRRHWSFLWRCL